MPDMNNMVNAMSSFLNGYQKEQEKLKEEKRVQGWQKKAQEYMDNGQATVKIVDGKPTISLRTPADVEKERVGALQQNATLQKTLLQVQVAKNPQKDIYEGNAEWKKKNAQSALMREFLGEQYNSAPQTSNLDRLTPLASKREVITGALKGDAKYRTQEGKINTGAIFNKLGITVEDFYKWSSGKHPDLAGIAFPGKTAIESRR